MRIRERALRVDHRAPVLRCRVRRGGRDRAVAGTGTSRTTSSSNTSLWICPRSRSWTLYIGLLRDREGFRLSALNLPLVLTLLRGRAGWPGVICSGRAPFAIALVTYVIAALSDVADGWIARRTGDHAASAWCSDPARGHRVQPRACSGSRLPAPARLGVRGRCAALWHPARRRRVPLPVRRPVRIQPTLFRPADRRLTATPRGTVHAAPRRGRPARRAPAALTESRSACCFAATCSR